MPASLKSSAQKFRVARVIGFPRRAGTGLAGYHRPYVKRLDIKHSSRLENKFAVRPHTDGKFGRAIPIRATATGEGLMCRLMKERFQREPLPK
jgi:hypothetical protein